MPVVSACQCVACSLLQHLKTDPGLFPCGSAVGQHAAQAGRAASPDACSPRLGTKYRHIANFDHWPVCSQTEKQQKADPALKLGEGPGADLSHSESCTAIRVIHCHVQAHTEVVLVQLGIQVGGDEGAMGGVHALPLTHHAGAQAAGQLHLILNAAILREALHCQLHTHTHTHTHTATAQKVSAGVWF